MWLAFTPGREQTVLRFAVALSRGEGSTKACVVSTARACEPTLVYHPLSADSSGHAWEEYAVPLSDAVRSTTTTTVVLYVSPLKTDDDT